MNLEFHLRLAGSLQIMLAALHFLFPKRFHWKEELSRLSLLNHQIFLVHTLFICYILILIGSLSLLAPHTLLQPTPLSRFVLGGFASFWALRLIVQLLVYDASLWRGNRFNTVVHILFTGLWVYLTGVYAGALLVQQWPVNEISPSVYSP